MAAPDTVVDLKKAFLTTQTRILNAPVELPDRWQDQVGSGEEGDIREGAVEDVLEKVNVIARHHNKAAYSSQTLRHVAEQIDALYWASGDRLNDLGSDEILQKAVDLRQEANIAKLPEQWPRHDELGEDELERYTALQQRLTELSARRDEARQQISRYKYLRDLLGPFKDPQETVQPNLVTRDGELGKELDRMRILIARVTGRVDGLPAQSGQSKVTEDPLNVPTEEDKFAGVLGLR